MAEEILGEDGEPTGEAVEAEVPDQQVDSEEDAEPIQQADEDKAEKGQLHDLIEKRRENAGLREENERMRNMIASYQQPEGEEVDDEEYLNVGGTRQLVNESVDSLRSEVQEIRNMNLEKEVRGKHSDYDTVFELCRERIGQIPDPQARETVVQTLVSMPNPYEAVYTYGSLHEDYQKKATTQKAKELLDEVQQKANQTPTISNIPSTRNDGKDYRKQIHDMNDNDFWKEFGVE